MEQRHEGKAKASPSQNITTASSPTMQNILGCFFFGSCQLKSKSLSPSLRVPLWSLYPPPPSLLPPFLLFLPGKDNQVYVKYVCSFDSRQYLINSITPSTIVPKVFEMRTRQGGLFKSCQSMLTFF